MRYHRYDKPLDLLAPRGDIAKKTFFRKMTWWWSWSCQVAVAATDAAEKARLWKVRLLGWVCPLWFFDPCNVRVWMVFFRFFYISMVVSMVLSLFSMFLLWFFSVSWLVKLLSHATRNPRLVPGLARTQRLRSCMRSRRLRRRWHYHFSMTKMGEIRGISVRILRTTSESSDFMAPKKQRAGGDLGGHLGAYLAGQKEGGKTHRPGCKRGSRKGDRNRRPSSGNFYSLLGKITIL